MLRIYKTNIIYLEEIENFTTKEGVVVHKIKFKDAGKHEYIGNYSKKDLLTEDTIFEGDILDCEIKVGNSIHENKYNATMFYLTNIVPIGKVPNLNNLKNKAERQKFGGKDFAESYSKQQKADYMNIDKAFNNEENKEEDYPDWMNVKDW